MNIISIIVAVVISSMISSVFTYLMMAACMSFTKRTSDMNTQFTKDTVNIVVDKLIEIQGGK